MPDSKELDALEITYKKVRQCNKKCSYKNKEAQEVQEKLDDKYKAKIDAALKLPRARVMPKIKQLNDEKRTEMKMNDIITRHYECMLKMCSNDLQAFQKASVDLARLMIADSEQRLAKGGLEPDLRKFLKNNISTNKKRIKLLEKSVTVPRLIDILYP